MLYINSIHSSFQPTCSYSIECVQFLDVSVSVDNSGNITTDLYRFICTFLTKAACCRNIESVLHPTTLSYIYIIIEYNVFLLVLIKVDLKYITLSRLCYYLSESTRGTNAMTMFFSPYIYILLSTLNFYVKQQHRSLASKNELRFLYSHLPTVHHRGRTQECSKALVVLLD